jgi:hypothetical protein
VFSAVLTAKREIAVTHVAQEPTSCKFLCKILDESYLVNRYRIPGVEENAKLTRNLL